MHTATAIFLLFRLAAKIFRPSLASFFCRAIIIFPKKTIIGRTVKTSASQLFQRQRAGQVFATSIVTFTLRTTTTWSKATLGATVRRCSFVESPSASGTRSGASAVRTAIRTTCKSTKARRQHPAMSPSARGSSITWLKLFGRILMLQSTTSSSNNFFTSYKLLAFRLGIREGETTGTVRENRTGGATFFDVQRPLTSNKVMKKSTRGTFYECVEHDCGGGMVDPLQDGWVSDVTSRLPTGDCNPFAEEVHGQPFASWRWTAGQPAWWCQVWWRRPWESGGFPRQMQGLPKIANTCVQSAIALWPRVKMPCHLPNAQWTVSIILWSNDVFQPSDQAKHSCQRLFDSNKTNFIWTCVWKLLCHNSLYILFLYIFGSLAANVPAWEHSCISESVDQIELKFCKDLLFANSSKCKKFQRNWKRFSCTGGKKVNRVILSSRLRRLRSPAVYRSVLLITCIWRYTCGCEQNVFLTFLHTHVCTSYSSCMQKNVLQTFLGTLLRPQVYAIQVCYNIPPVCTFMRLWQGLHCTLEARKSWDGFLLSVAWRSRPW